MKSSAMLIFSTRVGLVSDGVGLGVGVGVGVVIRVAVGVGVLEGMVSTTDA